MTVSPSESHESLRSALIVETRQRAVFGKSTGGGGGATTPASDASPCISVFVLFDYYLQH